MNNITKSNNLVVYQAKDGAIEFHSDYRHNTVWASQSDIATLFMIDQSVVSRHIRNIFNDGEIDIKSNMQKMHNANSDRPVTFYSLDIILGVGYRTNSKIAILFRKWATKTLKQHIIKGYTLNQKQLLQTQDKFNELQETIIFLKEKASHKLLAGQEIEIINLLASYSKTFTLLSKHDKDKLSLIKRGKGKFDLNYEMVIGLINQIKENLLSKSEASDLFGQENGQGLKSALGAICQTYGNQELYRSIEEKAANLLYLIIKDHPFVDGNKRIGSFLFVYFLNKNNYLYRDSGEKKINDHTLATLALLIAISDPEEKEKLIKLTTNLLN